MKDKDERGKKKKVYKKIKEIESREKIKHNYKVDPEVSTFEKQHLQRNRENQVEEIINNSR